LYERERSKGVKINRIIPGIYQACEGFTFAW
jgi:hypothetical protein